MDESLRRAVKAKLRPLGWSGSLPHLRRRGPDQICLLSVQHFSSNGSFAVNVAECGPDGVERHPPGKVTANTAPWPRGRLGSPDFPVGDHWFVYGPRNYEPDCEVVRPAEHYDRITAEVLRLIHEQAEPWWADRLAERS